MERNMPRARKSYLSLEATPYYHCMSRCVRKAFLCGNDAKGRSYEHRRFWIEQKILHLSKIFAIDLCAYAVMQNHYHIVVHVDQDRALSWTNEEVIKRWLCVFRGSIISEKFTKNEPLTEHEAEEIVRLAALWRERLTSLSWYMRVVNEGIARIANHEDNCTGRFWEGRFKIQALLDEKAIATCMAYVDLNPIRAKLAKTPEDSAYTSIKKRIANAKDSSFSRRNEQPNDLFPFLGDQKLSNKAGLPFHMEDYFVLVDWTGRQLCQGKQGKIPDNVVAILDRLQIKPNHWLLMSKHFESKFKGLVGMVDSIKTACLHLEKQWAHGMTIAEHIFGFI
jgi:REP element-mobilizing transposase RayT